MKKKWKNSQRNASEKSGQFRREKEDGILKKSSTNKDENEKRMNLNIIDVFFEENPVSVLNRQ